MRIHSKIIGMLLLCFGLQANAQQLDTNYSKEWLEIDTLIAINDHTKSALEKVNALYQRASAEKNMAQRIKALIYRYTFETKITSIEPDAYFEKIRKEISNSTNPVEKSLLNTIFARYLTNYMENNRWRLFNRSATTSYDSTNIITWSGNDFQREIGHLLLQALEQEALLKKYPLDGISAIVLGHTKGLTVYDLLMTNAIQQFSWSDSYTTNSMENFHLRDPRLLAPLQDFLQMPLPAKGSSSAKWITLNLYQRFLKSHLSDNDKSFLIQTDLERIEWVYEQIEMQHKDSLYLQTLNTLIQQHPNLPIVTEAYYRMALMHQTHGNQYHPFSDTTGQYAFMKSKGIIEKAWQTFSDTTIPGMAKMLNILSEIKSRHITLVTERVNLPNQPFRANAHYRNLDTCYIRILKMDGNTEHKLRYSREIAQKWDEWKKLPALKSWSQMLPATNDHQAHNTEIYMPALPAGEYIMLYSADKDFNDSLPKGAQILYVSNISFIQHNRNIFVMHRETGKPLANVNIVVKKINYNKGEPVYELFTTGKTDKNGQYTIQKVSREGDVSFNGNFLFEFNDGKDYLNTTNDIFLYYDALQDQSTPQTPAPRIFFFTDRGIYRPGQVLHYKGLSAVWDQKSLLPGIRSTKDSVWVYLWDRNNRKIDSFHHPINSYGSFYGSFRLPSNGLTGAFYLSTAERWTNHTSITVEEYKRPTFQITFEEVKGSYRLNDSITLVGQVKSYAGSNISNAKVSFQVVRNTQYHIPWYIRDISPYVQPVNLLVGDTVTDANGQFTIRFKAEAEDKIDSRIDASFTFSTHVSVTDIAGETRTGNKDIAMGLRSIQLLIPLAQRMESDSLQSIPVRVTNYNQIPEKAHVLLKIYRLQAPTRLIRKRIWAQPDQFTMSEQTFLQHFPYDEYRNETEMSTWERGELVHRDSIHTDKTQRFDLSKHTLPAGAYLLIATTTDKDGLEVSVQQHLLVFNSAKGQTPTPIPNLNWPIKNTVVPGDKGAFLFATDIPNIHVIQTQSRPNRPLTYQFQQRRKGFQQQEFQINEQDRGTIHISEIFVYQNRVYQNQYSINVPWSNKELNITYTTFRNKVEPGKQEKWTIDIQSADSSQQADAELLTAMYDASLDQFTPFNWWKPGIWNSYNNQTSYFNEHRNFSMGEPYSQYTANKFYPFSAPEPLQLVSRADELIRRNLLLNGWEEYANYYSLNSEYIDNTTVGSPIKRMSVMPAPAAEDAMNKSMELNETVTIRGGSSKNGSTVPLYIVNGVVVENMNHINQQDIEEMQTLKGEEAVALYGSKATNGVVIIRGKNIQPPIQTPIVPRNNFQETAFFLPQVYADSTGKYSFSFTMPDALTEWKWQSFAHTKDLSMGLHSTSIVSQKTLMVQANAPRFLREGDQMEFSGRITNLSDKELTGQVTLELVDATTGTSVDGWFQNVFPVQYFTAEAGQSTAIKFPIQIPFSFNKPLTWRLIARAGNFSDGEENILPVLSNRQLVIESMPMLLLKDTVQSFSFNQLLKANSPSLTHQSLTLNYTANPIWEAIRALPYLMEYPYECAEQSFNRFYAHALGAYILNSHPKIKTVFEAWKKDSTSLKGKLRSNNELKQILLEETPWVLEAANEGEQQQRLASLFDLFRLNQQSNDLIEQLQQMQLQNGAFSWFKGGAANPFITNYILTGIGKLKRIGAITPDISMRLKDVTGKAIAFMDAQMEQELEWLKKNKMDTARTPIAVNQVYYLYMRSLFRDVALPKNNTAYRFFYTKGKQFITKQTLYERALLGLVYFRNDEKRFVNVNILPAILENTVEDKKLGILHWKDRRTHFWYANPIEHQSTMIQFLQEVMVSQNFSKGNESLNMARNWLLMNKQTNHWNTTIATADACYSLLISGNDAQFNDRIVRISMGNETFSNEQKAEAGTGFFTQTIEGRKVTNDMGRVQVSIRTTGATNNHTLPSWGSLTWQYFEDMDKITPSTGNPFSITKQLYREVNSEKGKVLQPVQENEIFHPGDKVVIRMQIKSSRDLEYVHLKDTRASSMEPLNVLSNYKWQDGLGYYESTRDAATHFFFDQMRKGTYVFDYPVFITHIGTFSSGTASIQCMYAPEFNAHSSGYRIRVEE